MEMVGITWFCRGRLQERLFFFLRDTHLTASIFDQETRVTSTFTDIPVALVMATVPANLEN
jgi:hypothetical protein